MTRMQICLVLVATTAPAVAGADLFVDVTNEAGVAYRHQPTVDHRSGPMSGGGAVGDFNSDGYPDLYVIGSGGVADALFINQRNGRFVDEAAAWGIDAMHRGTGAAVADVDGDGDHDLFVTSFGSVESVFPVPGAHRLYRNEGGRFDEVAASAGVARTADYPEGYGATFGDIDLDGDLDLFVAGWHNNGVDNAFGMRLFLNDGTGNFEDVSETSGIMVTSTQSFGAAIVDTDGDRWPELFIAGDFGTSRYLRNNRDGTFTELDPGTGEPPTLSTDPNWSIGKAHNGMGVAVADIDRNGRPDFVLTAIWPTFHFESPYDGNGLYLNRGSHRFASVAPQLGIANGGWGWGVAAADFDHDTRIDIAMTNGWPMDDDVTGEQFMDEQAYVFFQHADGRFTEAALKAGLEHRQQGRALMTLDYDRDGDLDMAILSNRGDLRLYRNDLLAPASRARNHNWLQVRLDTSTQPDLAPGGLGARVRIKAGGATQHAWMTQSPSYLGAHEMLVHFGLGEADKVERLDVMWPNGRATSQCNIGSNRRIVVRAGGSPNGKSAIDCTIGVPLDSEHRRGSTAKKKN